MSKGDFNFLHRAKTSTSISLLLFFSFLLSMVKLWFISGQSFYAVQYALDDDILFLKNAAYLFHGQWLGPYTKWTLIKGTFYPLWIAASFASGLPLMFTQHVLYITACYLFVLSVKPIVQKPSFLLILFTALLFNPISYAEGVGTRVIREGIYPALTLLIFSGLIGLMVRHERPLRTLALWSTGLGLSLSAFWLTREEGVWMILPILIILGFTAIRIYQVKQFDWVRRLIFCILPFIILSASLLTVTTMNMAYYGVRSTVQVKWTPFLDAYGALTRVKHENWNPKIPVPKDVREKVYMAVPSFSELRFSLEGPSGNARISDSCQGISICNDIGGGWFMWAFRDAVADAGYYKSGETTQSFYKRLASEINLACSNKILDCGPARSTLSPPWHSEYTRPLATTFIDAAVFLAEFIGANASPGESSTLTQTANLKISILNAIGRIYQYIVPVLVILAFIAYIITTISVFRKHAITDLYIIDSAIISAIASRLFILSWIDVSSFPSVNILYLSPAYPLLLIFVVLSLIDGMKKVFRKTT